MFLLNGVPCRYLVNGSYPCDSPFKIAGCQKGCAPVLLPSFFRFRGGQSQKDRLSVYEAEEKESRLSCTSLWGFRKSACSSQEDKSTFSRADNKSWPKEKLEVLFLKAPQAQK